MASASESCESRKGGPPDDDDVCSGACISSPLTSASTQTPSIKKVDAIFSIGLPQAHQHKLPYDEFLVISFLFSNS
jgi:hypothetical protein